MYVHTYVHEQRLAMNIMTEKTDPYNLKSENLKLQVKAQ